MVLGRQFLIAVVLASPACVGGAVLDSEVDGGRVGQENCVDDAGEVPDGVDAGPVCTPFDAVNACAALVERTCEPTCEQSAGCAAARLTAQYEPDTCSAALANQLTFPGCTASPCDTLVERTCGGLTPTPECADSPGCPPARELRDRANDPGAGDDVISSALASCARALEDAVVFAACP